VVLAGPAVEQVVLIGAADLVVARPARYVAVVERRALEILVEVRELRRVGDLGAGGLPECGRVQALEAHRVVAVSEPDDHVEVALHGAGRAMPAAAELAPAEVALLAVDPGARVDEDDPLLGVGHREAVALALGGPVDHVALVRGAGAGRVLERRAVRGSRGEHGGGGDSCDECSLHGRSKPAWRPTERC
jgi:hypothetical protein